MRKLFKLVSVCALICGKIGALLLIELLIRRIVVIIYRLIHSHHHFSIIIRRFVFLTYRRCWLKIGKLLNLMIHKWRIVICYELLMVFLTLAGCSGFFEIIISGGSFCIFLVLLHLLHLINLISQICQFFQKIWIHFDGGVNVKFLFINRLSIMNNTPISFLLILGHPSSIKLFIITFC